ncbi:hypothetical protein BVX95_00880 [archaeon D22]|nr:hypothetical protein BVX95_00880 [archaeon D22]
MIELERSYLAKTLPDLKDCKYKEIIDIYFPKESRHPVLRLRKNGNKYELTKKQPTGEDKTEMKEETIILTKEEFDVLSQIDGKKVGKKRYYYNYNERIAEVDVFIDNLKGLVYIEFEFDSREEKEAFTKPDFCLVEITQDEMLAGGMICGKTMDELEPHLNKYGYKRID